MSSEVTSKKAWEQVVDWVEQRVLSGELVVGSTLPAERDLALRVGVSRPAVREAVRTLQASGVLRSSVGAGGSGGTTVTGVPHQALTKLLRMHVALASFPATDVTQVRVVLERLSTSLATQRADSEQLAGMRAQVELMDDDGLSIEEFNGHDTQFHVAIAEAAGNRLATDLTVAIRESMRDPILEGLYALDDWKRVRGLLRTEHHAVLSAIEGRRADEAADLVEEHIRAAFARMSWLHDR
ncbi:FadR/GntR family transcriptional regulator [Leekyejoonella antrihumi]|nr:FCD domain-containing protein [Leekyejoonella antrihumi]